MAQEEGLYALEVLFGVDSDGVEFGGLYVDRMRSVSLCTLENFTRHWKGKSIAEVKRLLP